MNAIHTAAALFAKRRAGTRGSSGRPGNLRFRNAALLEPQERYAVSSAIGWIFSCPTPESQSLLRSKTQQSRISTISSQSMSARRSSLSNNCFRSFAAAAALSSSPCSRRMPRSERCPAYAATKVAIDTLGEAFRFGTRPARHSCQRCRARRHRHRYVDLREDRGWPQIRPWDASPAAYCSLRPEAPGVKT
jgi:hypothetical protein